MLAIDLIRTFDNFDRSHKNKKLWPDSGRFGLIPYRLALNISAFERTEELAGIRRCIISELRLMRQKELFGFISRDVGDDLKIHENIDLVSDSLIYTTILFYQQLHNREGGLSFIMKAKLLLGLELISLWGASGSELVDPLKNDWLVELDTNEVKQYLHSNYDEFPYRKPSS